MSNQRMDRSLRTHHVASSRRHVARLALISCSVGLLAACVDDETAVELDDLEQAVPESGGLDEARDLDGVRDLDEGLGEVARRAADDGVADVSAAQGASDTVALAATKEVFVRGRQGSGPIILCRVPVEPVTYSSGQLSFTGTVTCGTRMASIEISDAGTYYKTSSSGSSHLYHHTGTFKASNTDRKSYYDYGLCRSGSRTVWWGGQLQFKLTWPSGWTAVAGTGYTVSGRVATGTVPGNFTAYNVGCI